MVIKYIIMKIYFCWPFNYTLISKYTEPYEFYNYLKEKNDIILVNNFDEADYIFYMMDIRNCYSQYNINELDINIVNDIKKHTNYHKEIIIDYNDWTDTRNVMNEMLHKVGFYFKRSIVNKTNLSLIKYDREIIPVSYGIRSDFIQYDSTYNFTGYKYDICYLFDGTWEGGETGGNRRLIKQFVNQYYGPKFIGRVDCPNRYGVVNIKYFEILRHSKIIVTANPTNWEGDFRLWEALLMGNLVLCDQMVIPHIMKHPLIDRKHLVFYKNGDELMHLINYYIHHEDERNSIGKEGREYCLKYHKFSDRVQEVLDKILYKH